jgi:hypothetical protein
MWMAVFADMGASLLVVFNALTLLKGQPTHVDHSEEEGRTVAIKPPPGAR